MERLHCRGNRLGSTLRRVRIASRVQRLSCLRLQAACYVSARVTECETLNSLRVLRLRCSLLALLSERLGPQSRELKAFHPQRMSKVYGQSRDTATAFWIRNGRSEAKRLCGLLCFISAVRAGPGSISRTASWWGPKHCSRVHLKGVSWHRSLQQSCT